MIDVINTAWGWTALKPKEILYENDFGNLLIEDNEGKFWRICPEELSCKVIAEDQESFDELFYTENFKKDWYMDETVALAKDHLGELMSGEKYCLKLPGVLGGLYEPENFGKISFEKLISFSGAIALEMQDITPEQLKKIIPEEGQ
ncbi:MAG: T6SS immunity protein Tdi1 domain-containing protein [Cyclobacteriaceae bacterium]